MKRGRKKLGGGVEKKGNTRAPLWFGTSAVNRVVGNKGGVRDPLVPRGGSKGLPRVSRGSL
eukprot:scaffold208363_cov27-Tisochrysis_lutea.AAC.1